MEYLRFNEDVRLFGKDYQKYELLTHSEVTKMSKYGKQVIAEALDTVNCTVIKVGCRYTHTNAADKRYLKAQGRDLKKYLYNSTASKEAHKCKQAEQVQ